MMQTDTANYFAVLNRHSYANLTTFRKNGQAIVTPVWFAHRDNKVYVMTVMDSGKVKRIRNNPQVLIGPSSQSGQPLGPTVEATARVLPADEIQRAKNALDDKYGLMKAVFDFFITLRGTERAWIEIAQP